MIKESYTENFYSYNSKYINNVLALRPPQHESLEIFARLCDTLSLAKNPTTTEQIRSAHQTELEVLDNEDKRTKKISEWASEVAAEFYADDLTAARALCPTLTSFERDFPSFCFALATGIGKTRLMGACIAYLRYEKGIKNFFVMAPNLTIYRKLKDDLGKRTQPVGKPYIIIPRVSSEKRRYIPMGFMDGNTIVTDLVQIVPEATLYEFGILTSNL